MYERDPIKIYDSRWEVGEFSRNEIIHFIESVLIYARELGVDTLTITRDARLGAGEVMELFIDIALHSGFTVYACTDPISTPMSYYFTLETTGVFSNTMGITITASHNPKQYIGLKLTTPTVQAIGLDSGPLGGFSRIRDIYHSKINITEQLYSNTRRGKLRITNPTERYIEFSMDKARVRRGSLSGIRVILDSFNGSAGPELFKAYREAGIEVYPKNLVPDGNFPKGSPNPISRGRMNDAMADAKKIGDALVIGTDGDGDRIVFGDSKGLFTAGFAFLAILDSIKECCVTPHAIPHKRVIYDPKVNPLALLHWTKYGIHPYLFRNGHSQIKEYMKKISAIAAVEESGHFYHYITMDNIHSGLSMFGENSILTTLLFFKSIKNNPDIKKYLWDIQNSVYSTGEFNFKFHSDKDKEEALLKIINHFKTNEDAEIFTHTGNNIDLQGYVITKGLDLNSGGNKIADTWFSGYFRSSTNEKSILRSYISASDEETVKRLEKIVIEINRQLGGEETE